MFLSPFHLVSLKINQKADLHKLLTMYPVTSRGSRPRRLVFTLQPLALALLCMLTLSALPHKMLILSGEVGTEKVAV